MQMIRFRRHLHRERRRIAIFGISVTLAAFLIYTDDIGQEMGVRYAAFSALGTGLGAGLVALGLLLLNPGWRHALDTVAITTLLYAMLIVQVPGVSFHEQTHSLVAFVSYLVAAAVLHLLVYGRWSDRWLRLRSHVERTTCLTGLDRQTLWASARPRLGGAGTYWDRTVESIRPADDDPEALILFHRFPNGMMMEQEVRFDQVNPGKSFRYSYRVIGAPERGPQSMAVILESRGETLAVHVRWQRANYPLRLALMHWIDDWGGRVCDRQLERLEAADPAAHDLDSAPEAT
jgi:hypothetical protein